MIFSFSATGVRAPVVRFALPMSAALGASKVSLNGTFLRAPIPATATGGAWVVELPIERGAIHVVLAAGGRPDGSSEWRGRGLHAHRRSRRQAHRASRWQLPGTDRRFAKPSPAGGDHDEATRRGAHSAARAQSIEQRLDEQSVAAHDTRLVVDERCSGATRARRRVGSVASCGRARGMGCRKTLNLSRL